MSAALELAPYGVTANMVHPPVTDTGWVTDAVRDMVAASPTLVHVATPDEASRRHLLPPPRRRRPHHREHNSPAL